MELNKLKINNGITMLEVVISLLLMSGGVLGLQMIQQKAIAMQQNGLNTVKAVLLFDSQFNKLRNIRSNTTRVNLSTDLAREGWALGQTDMGGGGNRRVTIFWMGAKGVALDSNTVNGCLIMDLSGAMSPTRNYVRSNTYGMRETCLAFF